MELAKVIDTIPTDRPSAILVRHAERKPIIKVQDAVDAPLVQAGKQAAQSLGKLLANLSPIRLFHSPVPRCKQTAEMISQGASSAGAQVSLEGENFTIGGPYMRDWNTAMGHVLKTGPMPFIKDWFAGKLPDELAKDARESASEQVSVLLEQLTAPDASGCTLNVTHDWNIILVRHFFLGLELEKVGWPHYMEAVVASMQDSNTLRLTWAGKSKDFKLPLMV